ncbi:MAG: fibrobacter succinogenes major paralogous domain-containing protein [Bacteroidetes bacterium]|nr:fibrobacter succinogenes major paralogous domain-containing protein [Bacteroidota bacterium]
MKTTLTLATAGLLACSSWAATSQTVLPPTYPFNPDSDGDEFVAVSDVLLSVAAYDNVFEASPLMVDTLTLEQAIQILLERQIVLEANQAALINGLSNSLAGVDGFDPCLLQWTCGCPVEYNGYSYSTVQIGDQCWFAENLRTELYANGDSIAQNWELQDWDFCADHGIGYTTSHTEIPDDEWPYPYATNPVDEFGLFYNWYAAVDDRHVCPSGWHLPAMPEFQTLFDAVGGQEVAGGALKTVGTLADGTGLWQQPNSDASNAVGFNGKPAGKVGGNCGNVALSFIAWDGWFWSSTEYESNKARSLMLNFGSANGIVGPQCSDWCGNKNFGYNIRCVQD